MAPTPEAEIPEDEQTMDAGGTVLDAPDKSEIDNI